jgi:hypothetical protein
LGSNPSHAHQNKKGIIMAKPSYAELDKIWSELMVYRNLNYSITKNKSIKKKLLQAANLIAEIKSEVEKI